MYYNEIKYAYHGGENSWAPAQGQGISENNIGARQPEHVANARRIYWNELKDG